MSTKHVLLVAGESDETRGLATYLEDRGFATQVAVDDSEALPLFGRTQHDFVLVDSDLPGLVLTDFVEAVLKLSPATKVIVISEMERVSQLHRVLQIGVACYVRKPFDKEQLGFQMEKFRQSASEESACS